MSGSMLDRGEADNAARDLDSRDEFIQNAAIPGQELQSLCDKELQKPDFANPVHLDKRQQRVAISDSVKSCDSRRSPGCSV